MFNPAALEKMRIKSNLSQNEVARLLNVTHPEYNRWENGVRIPNYNVVCILADLFECSMDDFNCG